MHLENLISWRHSSDVLSAACLILSADCLIYFVKRTLPLEREKKSHYNNKTSYSLLSFKNTVSSPHVFSLFSLLCRRIDDNMGRTHELEHSAIKCMRGILYCYMRQADKVSFLTSLHSALAFTLCVCRKAPRNYMLYYRSKSYFQSCYSSEPRRARALDTSGSSFIS